MPPESPFISELTESYETADRFTREVAQFRSTVATPASNELRYAGHHLLQALDGQEQISKPEKSQEPLRTRDVRRCRGGDLVHPVIG